MNFKEAYDRCMPIEKRKKEQSNLWVAYVGRPLTVWMTLPLINTKVHPITITKISIICAVVGFGMMAFGSMMPLRVAGWSLFFLWGLLDGVDGNLARCQNRISKMGELWDAVGGYAAMALQYMAAGVVAYHDTPVYAFCDPYLILLCGAFTALISLFPRLIMHKKLGIIPQSESTKALNDKVHFSMPKVVATNLISVSGIMQEILLVCMLTHTINFFVAVYFLFNLGIMLMSMRSMLKIE